MSNLESGNIVPLRQPVECQTCLDDDERVNSLGHTIRHAEPGFNLSACTCPACGRVGTADFQISGWDGFMAARRWFV